ncbi:MAG: RNA polymerase sigma factor [Phycisphaeraceae bacterium]|nr:RNA polymerase sigma factor [Phycisphaeraceae bacterium]
MPEAQATLQSLPAMGLPSTPCLADARIFEALYRETYPAVVGLIYRRTGNEDLARDLACDTFLIAWRKAPHFRSVGVPPLHWLFRIATHRVNRWARDERRRLRREAHAARPNTVPATNDDADFALTALLRLSPRHQSVISLRCLHQLSVEQTAEVLDISPGTVKSRLARARSALARELSRPDPRSNP